MAKGINLSTQKKYFSFGGKRVGMWRKAHSGYTHPSLPLVFTNSDHFWCVYPQRCGYPCGICPLDRKILFTVLEIPGRKMGCLSWSSQLSVLNLKIILGFLLNYVSKRFSCPVQQGSAVERLQQSPGNPYRAFCVKISFCHPKIRFGNDWSRQSTEGEAVDRDLLRSLFAATSCF